MSTFFLAFTLATSLFAQSKHPFIRWVEREGQIKAADLEQELGAAKTESDLPLRYWIQTQLNELRKAEAQELEDLYHHYLAQNPDFNHAAALETLADRIVEHLQVLPRISDHDLYLEKMRSLRLHMNAALLFSAGPIPTRLAHVTSNSMANGRSHFGLRNHVWSVAMLNGYFFSVLGLSILAAETLPEPVNVTVAGTGVGAAILGIIPVSNTKHLVAGLDHVSYWLWRNSALKKLINSVAARVTYPPPPGPKRVRWFFRIYAGQMPCETMLRLSHFESTN